MEISNIATQTSSPVHNGAKKAEAAQTAAPKAENAERNLSLNQDQQVRDVQKTEQQRLDTVVQAASTFKNIYAVSDITFSIFKDTSGQFVTRFTSLKDGSITYIPEPDISRFVETNQSRSESLIKIQA